MKFSFSIAIIAGCLCSGCSAFLPKGEPPKHITGTQTPVDRSISLQQAEAAMAVSLTQFVVKRNLAPVKLCMISSPDNNRGFLNSLDSNLFKIVENSKYEYLLISSMRNSSWTLSLKKKDAPDSIWKKTIDRIQK